MQSELQVKDKMLAEFHKVEYSEKEARIKGHFPKRKKENGKRELLFKNKNNNFCTRCQMSCHWIAKNWKLHPNLCLKKKMKGGKVPTKRQVAASTGVDSLTKKIEKELSFLACFGSIVYEDIEAWFVDSGSSCHMT